MDFAVPADYRVKLKKYKKRDKYLDIARELKKIMKVMVMPIVTGALGTVTKWLLLKLEDLEIIGTIDSIQTTGLLWPEYWEESGIFCCILTSDPAKLSK